MVSVYVLKWCDNLSAEWQLHGQWIQRASPWRISRMPHDEMPSFFGKIECNCTLVAPLQTYLTTARCMVVKHATSVSCTRIPSDTSLWKDRICFAPYPAHHNVQKRQCCSLLCAQHLDLQLQRALLASLRQLDLLSVL